MKKTFCLILLIFSFSLFSFSQVTVYPSHWWVGMKHNKVQLLMKQKEGFIFPDKLSVSTNYVGVKIEKVTHLENKKYLLVDISIDAAAKVGDIILNFAPIAANEKFSTTFPLKPRRTNRNTAFAQGVTSADNIYLLMPERFSNGDKSNDKVAGMLDQTLNRDSIYHRHGGDLQGVINHLDYIRFRF